MSQFRAGSYLVDRQRLGSRLGYTFDGKRDVAQALGYQTSLTTMDFRSRYARNPVAARVVEAGPKGTWRGGCEAIEIDTPDKMTEFEKAMDALTVRLNVWQVLMRTDILAGMGRYACILIGAPGALDREMPQMNGPEDILYLSPYAEDEMLILEYDEEYTSSRWGMPTMYQLTRAQAPVNATGPSRLRPTLTKPVHWSRVIHFADNVLDDRVFGQPRLERVWNKLDDLDKVTGGGAEAFWQNANRGIQFDVDPTLMMQQPELDELQEEADAYMHGYRRSIRTRGVTINPLGSDTADFNMNAMAILQQISSGSGIPLRILIGAEAGELASTQDRSNWNDRVNDRRIESADPFVRQFIDRLIAYNVVPTPKQYRVEWPRPEDMTEFERVEAVAKMAAANKDQVEATGIPIMVTDEMRDRFLHSAPMDEEDKKAAQEREQAAVDAEIEAQKARASAKPAAKPASSAKKAARSLTSALAALDADEMQRVLSRDAIGRAEGIVAEALAEVR
jgi:hypothetical protein